jgi:hypothetical protein
MAKELSQQDIGYLVAASNNMANNQYQWVAVSGNFTANIAGANDVALFGILQDKPAVAGAACRIRREGMSKLKLGANTTVGTRVTSDANGLGAPANAANQRYGAIALETGAANDIIAVQMEFGKYVAA